MAKEKKLIDKLTPAQEAKIPEYLERYRAIGLSTEPTDKAAAEAAVRKSYEYLSKSQEISANPEFVWAESPHQGAVIAAQLAKGDKNVTDEEVQDQADKASYGSFEAYWVSVYAFIGEQLPVEKNELLDIVVDIVKHCGVYWTFSDIVVMTPKPTAIHMKDGLLHNETGLALEYPNKDGLYEFAGERKGSLMEVSMAARAAKSSAQKGK